MQLKKKIPKIAWGSFLLFTFSLNHSLQRSSWLPVMIIVILAWVARSQCTWGECPWSAEEARFWRGVESVELRGRTSNTEASKKEIPENWNWHNYTSYISSGSRRVPWVPQNPPFYHFVCMLYRPLAYAQVQSKRFLDSGTPLSKS